jgi:hypothetical protein
MDRQPLVQNIPKFLRRFRTLGAPPEPTALSLMQRPPKNWHAFILQLLQLYGNGVDVFDEQCVVCVRVIEKRGLDVEIRRLGVEAAVPWLSETVSKRSCDFK